MRFLLVILLSFWTFGAIASNSGVTYQGRIIKPDGTPLSGAVTQFKMQIRTPDSASCLMYEEMQSIDMRNSNGAFSLTINDGTGSRTDTTSLNLDRIFANRGSFTFDPSTCASGSTYAPNPSDGRALVVLFKDETMTTWEPIPAQKINFVPFAFESKQIAGFTPESLVRIEDAGVLGNVSPLSNAQYTALLALANGTSTAYTPAGQLNGSAMPTMASGEVLGWNGSAWVSTSPVPAAGSITSTMIQAAAVGTSQIASNVTISTSGTVGAAVTTTRDFKIYAASPSTFAIDMQAPALTASYSLVWPSSAGSAGQVLTTDGAGVLTWAPAAASSQWTTHGSNISYDGGGNVGIGTSSPLTLLHVVSTSGSSAVRLSRTDDSTQKSMISLYPQSASAGTPAWSYGIDKSSAGFSITSYNGTTTTNREYIDTNGYVGIGTTSPTALLHVAGAMVIAGTGSETCDSTHYVGGVRYNAGNIQFCNGTTWSTLGIAGSGISSLTGDVTATGPGAVAATVALVGGSTAANVHAAELLANAATNADTASTIVRRDASGNFSAGAISYKDSASNTVTVQAPTTVTTSYVLKLPAALPTGSSVLQTDTSGNLSWGTPTATGTAGGDLSGTYPNPTVATIGTSTAANVHAAELLANAATSANTNNAIVKRDGVGSFNANIATLNGLALSNGATSNITLTTPAAFTSYSLQLPTTYGGSGQVLTSDGAGHSSWTAGGTSQWTAHGSNISYDGGGRVGIGTTSPADTLEVSLPTAASSLRITDPTNGLGFSITANWPSIHFNNYYDGSQKRAMGAGYTGEVYLDPGSGALGFVVGSNPGAGNVITGSQAMTLTNGGELDVPGSMKLGSPGSYTNIAATSAVYSANQITDSFGNLLVGTVSPWAIDNGAQITLAGEQGPGMFVTMASVAGRKETTNGSDYSSYMSLATTVSDGTNTEQMRITSKGNVGIGTTSPSAKLTVGGTIVSKPVVVNSGATADLAQSNTVVMKSIGGSSITLGNMIDGGNYSVIVKDTNPRMYSFANCATQKFLPANATTSTGTWSIYTILSLDNGAGGFDCMITWATGYQ